MTSATLTRARRLHLLVTLGVLSAFGPLSLDLYLPVLPELAASLDTTDSLGQLTISMCMIGLATGQLLAGPLSDRTGRRVPLLVGVVLYVVTSVLCALAPNIWTLIVLRLLQGLAGAAGLVIARAIVRDLFDGAEAARVFSLMVLVTGLAPILAPLAGGQIARFTDWRGQFVALAVIGAVIAAAAFTLPETLPAARRHDGGLREALRHFGLLVRDRWFLGHALVISTSFCALFAYISFSSFVLQSAYAMSQQGFSVVFAVNALGLMIAGQVNGAVVRRFPPRRMLAFGVAYGLTGTCLAVAAVLLGWGLPGLLPGIFVTVSGMGLIMPNATALAMEPHAERAGTASALIGMLQFVTGAAVPPLAALGGATAPAMTLTMVGSMAVALLLLLLLRTIRQPITTPTPR
ncbi:multidrug effflux MFS transporter [Thermopolyspora sp. NPDC052614]|uniref:multidrug effflux MFS transporter n=1 Tax=Thermopolyspora sp. NPDC052614 TaxID=3155682 RepID=UPI003417AFB6